jgi:hypothetical protein
VQTYVGDAVESYDGCIRKSYRWDVCEQRVLQVFDKVLNETSDAVMSCMKEG